MLFFKKHVLNLIFLFLGFVTFLSDKTLAQTIVNTSANSTTSTADSKAKSDTNDKTRVATTTNNASLANILGGHSGWRFQGSFTQIPKLRNDQEDTSEILARADYTINKKHRIRFQQYFTKFYTVYRDENEFKPADTTISHYYNLDYKPYDTSLMWNTTVSLPVSNESARDDLITRVTGSMIATKTFFNGKLMVFGIPYVRYHWYEFNMSKSGRHLPWYTLGGSLAGLYFITPKLSLYYGMNYNFETMRQSQFDQNPKQVTNGAYSFDLSASYQFTDSLSGSLSYFQGANYIQNGRYELVFYDNQNSRMSLGMTYVY